MKKIVKLINKTEHIPSDNTEEIAQQKQQRRYIIIPSQQHSIQPLIIREKAFILPTELGEDFTFDSQSSKLSSKILSSHNLRSRVSSKYVGTQLEDEYLEKQESISLKQYSKTPCKPLESIQKLANIKKKLIKVKRNCLDDYEFKQKIPQQESPLQTHEIQILNIEKRRFRDSDKYTLIHHEKISNVDDNKEIFIAEEVNVDSSIKNEKVILDKAIAVNEITEKEDIHQSVYGVECDNQDNPLLSPLPEQHEQIDLNKVQSLHCQEKSSILNKQPNAQVGQETTSKMLNLNNLEINNLFKCYYGFEFEQIRQYTQSFVDRSLLLVTIFIDFSGVQAFLITHPRRSGKSVNMQMIKEFCQLQIQPNGDPNLEKQEQRKQLFLGNQKGIMDKEYLSPLRIAPYCGKNAPLFCHFGTYPVIFMNLKGVNGSNIDQVKQSLIIILSTLFNQYTYLIPKLKIHEQLKFNKYLQETINEGDIINGLSFLCDYLNQFHKKQVIVLVDEYDKFINSLLDKTNVDYNFVQETAGLISSMLCEVGKNNQNVSKLIITGIFDILIKEQNSGLNTLKILGISNLNLEGYFGLTEKEIQDKLEFMLNKKQANYTEKFNHLMKLIKKKYNGYYGVRAAYYNIWSVYCYFEQISQDYKNKTSISKPSSFWTRSGFNKTLLSIMKQQLNPKVIDKLLKISLGFSQNLEYNEQFVDVIQQLPKDILNQETLYSYLLMNSGYITRSNKDRNLFKAPNEEVREYFYHILQQYMQINIGTIPQLEFRDAILLRNEQRIQLEMQKYLKQTLSFRDLQNKQSFPSEQIYHSIMIGLLYCVKDHYGIHSEQESGNGYADMILVPKHSKDEHAIIFEFKIGQKIKPQELDPQDKLQDTITQAIHQVNQRDYKSFLEKNNFKYYSIIAIAFSGKHVSVKVEEHSLQ